MTAQAQGVRLDQHRPAGLAHPGDGGGEGAQGGGNVGRAIERLAFDAVAGGPAPQLGAGGVLLADRCRIGVAVVLDHEEDRQVQQRGEIERLMGVAGAARTIAHERETHRRPAEASLRVRRADDGRHHGAEMADHRE